MCAGESAMRAEVVGMGDGAPTTAAAGEGEAREVPRVELGARRRRQRPRRAR
jgi:hypothetical protein